jgi:hypothetical protein
LAKQTITFWTGVVIINAGQAEANLVYTVRDDEGSTLDAVTEETLAAGAKRVFLVDQNRQDFGAGASWLTVEGDQPLNGYMLFGTYPPDDRFSGFQSVKLAGSNARNLCLPYLDESAAGGYTGVALVNPGPGNLARLRLIDVDGNEKERVDIPLSANQKLVNLASQLFDTPIEQGDKILVQSSQPVVAFEIFGRGAQTLGGILAISY